MLRSRFDIWNGSNLWGGLGRAAVNLQAHKGVTGCRPRRGAGAYRVERYDDSCAAVGGVADAPSLWRGATRNRNFVGRALILGGGAQTE